MLRRFRHWLITKYLPAYVSSVHKEDISAYQRKIDTLTRQLEKERAFSAGLQTVMRQRVNIRIEK